MTLEQLAFVGDVDYDDSVVHEKGLASTLWEKHMRFHRGFPETYMRAIRSLQEVESS